MFLMVNEEDWVNMVSIGSDITDRKKTVFALSVNNSGTWVREAPMRKYSSSFGHCPFGGEGV